MGKYNGAVITTAGQNLIAQAISGGDTVTWTTMQASSYAYPAGTNLEGLTALQNVEDTATITSAAVFRSNILQVSARFNNAGVTEPYLINTLGIFAQIGTSAAVLVAVITAVTPDQMPVEDLESPSAFIYNAQLTIQNADQITVTTNPAGTATVEDLNNLSASVVKYVDLVTYADIKTTPAEDLENKGTSAGATKAILNDLVNLVYPIGSIYTSVNSTSPADLFGGTWEQLENRFLLAAGSAHAAGTTGGSEDAVIPYHDHSFTGSAVNTGTQSANHTHDFSTGSGGAHGHDLGANNYYHVGNVTTGGYSHTLGGGQTNFTTISRSVPSTSSAHTHSGTTGNNKANHTHTVTAAGTVGYAGTEGNVEGANMPPYLAVYMWKRTA